MRKIVTSMGLAGLVLAATPAFAQPAKGTTSSADARARFEEGVKLAEAGDHEHARLKFVQALAVLKHWSILFNLARAEQLSGHPVDALRHYKEFAKLTDPKIPPAQRDLAQSNIAELTSSLGQLAIEAPSGATVTIDGDRVEGDPSEAVSVMPGAHVVEASAGGKVKNAKVTAEAGVVTKVSLVDAPAPVAPPPAPTPVAPAPTATESERSTSGYVVPSVLAVAGLAGIGLGVGFAMASQNAKDDTNRLGQPLVCVDRASAGCKSYTDAHDKVHSDATIAYAGYIAGGVLLAGAIGTFVFWPKKTKTTGLRVTPIVGPGTAAASATYTF